jgi:hypothetical protein
MRGTLAAIGAAAFILVAVMASARAEDAAWCLVLDIYTRNCGFASYNECVEATKNLYVKTLCVRNEQYHPPEPAPRKTPRRP